MEWFSTWFDSPYYHTLYQHRNDEEAHFFIDNIIDKFQPSQNTTMLDLACGKGRHSIYLSNKGFDVTGVDLSPQSIEAANEHTHKKLHFHVQDMREKFKESHFDFIFNFFTSFGYFSDENDHKKTLDAIRYGLKDNGIFVMDFMNADKISKNLVAKEEKTIQGITFHIRRRYENNIIKKEIRFSDQGKDFNFEENVRAFSISDMARLLRKSNLELMSVHGDYALGNYDIFNSNRMILIAKSA